MLRIILILNMFEQDGMRHLTCFWSFTFTTYFNQASEMHVLLIFLSGYKSKHVRSWSAISYVEVNKMSWTGIPSTDLVLRLCTHVCFGCIWSLSSLMNKIASRSAWPLLFSVFWNPFMTLRPALLITLIEQDHWQNKDNSKKKKK